MLGSGAVLHHPIVVDINSVVGDDSVMMSEQKDIDSDKNVTAIDDDPIYVGGSVDNLQCNSVVEDSAPNGNVNAKTDDDYRQLIRADVVDKRAGIEKVVVDKEVFGDQLETDALRMNSEVEMAPVVIDQEVLIYPFEVYMGFKLLDMQIRNLNLKQMFKMNKRLMFNIRVWLQTSQAYVDF